MYWYVIKSFPNDRSTTTILWDITQNIVTSPIYIEGKIYGTKENPFVKNRFAGSPERNYATNRRRLYYGDTVNIAVYDATYKNDIQYGGYYGYGCSVFGVETELEIPSTLITHDTRVSSIDSATISGKFRLHNVITSNCLYNSFAIPVNFSINNVYYKSFGVLSTAGVGGYFDYNVPKIESDFLTGWYNSLTNNRVIQIQTEDDIINGTYTRLNVDTTANIIEDFAGSIIDFGVVPQEVPKFLLDFISENADPIYPNTFTIKSQNGDEVYNYLDEAPTMVKGYVSVVGTVKTLVLTGSNGRDYTLSWDSPTPEDKIFIGLSFKPNNRVSNIPVGVETDFNLEGNIVLYECYKQYKPPVKTFSVTLYKNSAEANRVDKTNYLEAVDTINGVLRTSTSITTLEIAIENSTLPQFNYCYIPALNRYYFVDDISSLRFGLWKLNLSVDPLMTYKDAILSCFAFVDRNEFDFNDNIIDKKMVVEQGVDVDIVEFGNNILSTNNQFYKYCITGYKIGVGTKA